MDDFNREKRWFTIGEVKEFAEISLNNYYQMNQSAEEFENYDVTRNASLFILSLNPDDQTGSADMLTFDESKIWNETKR